jgi:23S rRNA pseudouridine1911/1915/1917 synthase
MTNYSIEPNERVTFKTLFEDDSVFVVIKPPGVVTQPGLGHEGDSLLNGLFARWGDRLQALGRARDFGLLHRLDRQTSGLVVGALRARVYDALREAFSKHEVRKFYWAVVRGSPKQETGVIRKPIQESAGRDAGTPPPERRSRGDVRSRMKLARISSSGKAAVTAYRVLQAGRAASLLECRTLTGRLHQVRVHLESIGCPILGDDLYAPPAVARGAPRLAGSARPSPGVQASGNGGHGRYCNTVAVGPAGAAEAPWPRAARSRRPGRALP